MGGHVRLNSSRHGQEQPILFFFFIDNKSTLHFPDSCQVITSDSVPSVRSPSLRRRYAVALVLVPGPGRVQGATLQQPVDDVSARLLVLVSEQGVHEGVAGCLAVS